MPQVSHRLNVGNNLHGSRCFQSANDKDATGAPLPVSDPTGLLIPTVRGQWFQATASGIPFISTGLTAADWAKVSGGSLFSEGAEKSTGNAAFTTISSFTLIGGTLGAAGDMLLFDAFFFFDTPGSYTTRILFGGTSIYIAAQAASTRARISLRLVRFTATTWRLHGIQWLGNGTASTDAPATLFGGAGDLATWRFAGTDDLDTDKLIEFQARNVTTASLARLESFTLALA